MSIERYEVVRTGKGWTINHDGEMEGDYETKEAAFESIAIAASNAIKDGVGVVITIPARASGETAVGGKP